jgi:hypothetical protein
MQFRRPLPKQDLRKEWTGLHFPSESEEAAFFASTCPAIESINAVQDAEAAFRTRASSIEPEKCEMSLSPGAAVCWRNRVGDVQRTEPAIRPAIARPRASVKGGHNARCGDIGHKKRPI